MKSASCAWGRVFWAAAAFAFVTVLSLAGCNATYSPPIKPFGYTSPARSEAGTLGVQGAWSALIVRDIQGSISYAPLDHLQIELGGDYLHEYLAMGNLTLRAALWPALRQPHWIKFLQDFELGGGLGIGGELYGNDYTACIEDGETPRCDRRQWTGRVAGGGYAGLGLGIGFDWRFANRYVRDLEFDLFTRGRYQLSRATGVPLTHWLVPMAGVQFRFNRQIRLNIGTAGHWYWNDYDQDHWGSMLELGLGFDYHVFARATD